MVDPILGGTANKAIGAALNGLAARQRVISNNLANIDTPGFKGSEVRFEDQLQQAVAKGGRQTTFKLVSTNPGHVNTGAAKVDDVQPETVHLDKTTLRLDGNNVDIDKEMVELADTTLSYNALVQMISARISLTRYIINEGRR